MNIKSLVPWSWNKENLALSKDPFWQLPREMKSLFDDFSSNFGLDRFEGGFKGFNPRVDVTESDKEYKVTAELPGIDEKDIDISVTRKDITIKGEKKEEKEDKGDEGYSRMERSFGSFHRTIGFTTEVDTDKVDAKFKNGVLTITLPKTPEAVKETKKIAIKAA